MPERKKAGRRSNNEGCIRQRPNGLWEAQYIASYKPDGRPVRRSIYGKKKAEVRMKLRDILLSIERDEYIEPSRLTLGDWLEEWFRIYCLPHKKASTCTGYEDEIFLHIKPYIGRIPLSLHHSLHPFLLHNPPFTCPLGPTSVIMIPSRATQPQAHRKESPHACKSLKHHQAQQ